MRAVSAALLLSSATSAQESRPGPESRPEGHRFLQGEARAAFLADIERGLGAASYVAATFEQEKRLAIFRDPVRSRGVLAYRAPGDLRWEIREPFRSLLVVAGRDVGKFEFDEGVRRRVRLGRGGDVLLSVMERIRDWFAGKFDASECVVDVAREPAPRVRLTPRGGGFGGGLAAIDLALTPALDAVESVTLTEKSGDATVMRFERRPGASRPPDAAFSTTDPSDYDPRDNPASRPATRRSD